MILTTVLAMTILKNDSRTKKAVRKFIPFNEEPLSFPSLPFMYKFVYNLLAYSLESGTSSLLYSTSSGLVLSAISLAKQTIEKKSVAPS